jgi:hypothetical protein
MFELEANLEVDALEVVPEHLRPLYHAQNDKFVINPAMKGLADTIIGLGKASKTNEGAKSKANKEAATARTELKAFRAMLTDLGITGETDEDIKTAFGELKKQLGAAGDGKVNWDKMKTDLEKAFNTQLGAKDKELKDMLGALHEHMVTGEAIRAIASEKGVPELLLPHVSKFAKVIKDDNGKYVTRVVDEAGDPRGDGKGGFMSIGDYVKGMKSDKVFARAFEADERGGTGAPPTTRKPTGGPGALPAGQQKSSLDKIKSGLSAGLATSARQAR